MFVWLEKILPYLLLLLFVQLIFNVGIGESQSDKYSGGNRKLSDNWSSSSSAQSGKNQQSFNGHKLFTRPSTSFKSSQSSTFKDQSTQGSIRSKPVQLPPKSKDYPPVPKGGSNSRVVTGLDKPRDYSEALKQKGSSKHH